MTAPPATEDLLRTLAPQVLGALVRRYGHFDAAEDSVQEALLAAAVQWPAEGRPDNPAAWLSTVATRRMIDQLRGDERPAATRGRRRPPSPLRRRRDRARGRRHAGAALPVLPPRPLAALAAGADPPRGRRSDHRGDRARVPRPRGHDGPAHQPGEAVDQGVGARPSSSRRLEERAARLGVVLHVLYLVFNEGYATSAGDDLQRADLTTEAIRLTRLLHEMLPDDGEVTGLLALMLLTEARRGQRSRADGALVPLDEQDRSQWDHALIAEGVALIASTLGQVPLGPYQLQAAIAAVHDEAPSAEDTDWAQILALYEVLDQVAPNPMATLNRAVAVAEVHGPAAGLDLLATLDDDRARRRPPPAARGARAPARARRRPRCRTRRVPRSGEAHDQPPGAAPPRRAGGPPQLTRLRSTAPAR